MIQLFDTFKHIFINDKLKCVKICQIIQNILPQRFWMATLCSLFLNVYICCWSCIIQKLFRDCEKKPYYVINHFSVNVGVFVMLCKHNDGHQMEIFSASLAFVREIHQSPVGSPHKCQWHGALMFSLICAWTNGWANSRDASDLRRHRAHCQSYIY